MVDFSTFLDRYENRVYRSTVFCLRFSPNAQLPATGTYNGKINVCSLKTSYFINLMSLGLDMGHCSKANERTMLKEHTGVIDVIAFSPNGHSLISGSQDQSLRIWNLRDGSSKVMPVSGTTAFFRSVPMDGTLQGGILAARSGYGTRAGTSLWKSGRDILKVGLTV